jgi:hypothetical protein
VVDSENTEKAVVALHKAFDLGKAPKAAKKSTKKKTSVRKKRP